jgi:predicted MFS family arabinose efflux permease
MALISRILPKTVTTQFELLKYKSDLLRPKVLFFLLIVFLFAIHFGAENTSYGLFLEKTLGLSKQMMGVYMGAAIFIMGFWAVLFSKLLKKTQVKSLLFTGLLFSSIGHVFMTLRDPVYSFLFRMFHEAGDAAMFVFFAYGITSMFNIKRIGGNTSMVTFTTIIGATIGSLAFGPLGEKFGYDIPMIATGIVIFIAFIIALFFNRYILKHKTS